MTRWFWLLALLSPALAPADDDAAMALSVKPVLCIIDKRTPRCELTFLVLWESRQRGFYCLFNDFGDSPLRCWNDERQGRHGDERSVEQSFEYWMATRDSGPRLATIAVEVLRMDTDDRRRKRRTRHVWDIN